MTKKIKYNFTPDEVDGPHYLWEACEKFIMDNDITCPETIAQCDRVIRNAYELIEEICNIIGYVEKQYDN